MKIKLACAVVLMETALLGCSVRLQAPVKAVAYDFSDRDFYDRGYAPSPDYGRSADATAPRIEPPAPSPGAAPRAPAAR
jgi:hypothetical protein